MTAQRGDFDAPAPVLAAARDTWRRTMIGLIVALPLIAVEVVRAYAGAAVAVTRELLRAD